MLNLSRDQVREAAAVPRGEIGERGMPGGACCGSRCSLCVTCREPGSFASRQRRLCCVDRSRRGCMPDDSAALCPGHCCLDSRYADPFGCSGDSSQGGSGTDVAGKPSLIQRQHPLRAARRERNHRPSWQLLQLLPDLVFPAHARSPSPSGLRSLPDQGWGSRGGGRLRPSNLIVNRELSLLFLDR